MFWLDGGLFGSFDRQQLSDLAGTASFVVWLFAQSPQLYENYRNASCEGLSLVFLAQWMAGDVTNLVGSVLTQQLPFQIAVATYFCCIDLCILMQYYYYWQRDRRIAKKRERLARRYQHTYHGRLYESPRTVRAYSHADRSEVPLRGESVQSTRTAAVSLPSSTQSSMAPLQRPVSTDHRRSRSGSTVTRGPQRRQFGPVDVNYRALGEAAKSVAELANETERRIAMRDARRRRAWEMAWAAAGERESNEIGKLASNEAGHTATTAAGEQDSAGEEEAPEHMMSSVASGSSHDGDGYGYGFGVASTPNISALTRESVHESPDIHRGRGMVRTAGILGSVPSDISERPPNLTQVKSRTNSPARRAKSSRPSVSRGSTRGTISTLSSRQSGMVLLGIAGLMAWRGPGVSDPDSSSLKKPFASVNFRPSTGSVLSPAPLQHEALQSAQTLDLHFSSAVHPDSRPWLLNGSNDHDGLGRTPFGHPPPPTWERTIGRISAWTCTILYMTSRLPQIWTNMQRRSVQGLSILLFFSAATGNLFYTLSILLNPKAQSPPNPPEARRTYLMESLPFLLGSGGTLLFDAVIVAQWIAWRGRAPHYPIGGVAQPPSMLPSTGSYTFHTAPRPDVRSRNSSVRTRWRSLERQPLLE